VRSLPVELESFKSDSGDATPPAPLDGRSAAKEGSKNGQSDTPSRYIANNPRPPLLVDAKPTPLVEADEAKKSRYRLQNQAARLLPDMRISHCCRTIQDRTKPIRILKRLDVQDKDTTRFSFAGLQTCGSVHVCPHCAPYVASTRQKEVEHFIQWAQSEGYLVLFMTLTHPHTDEMSLPYQMGKLLGTGEKKRGGAIARFTRSKAWARLDRVGYIRRIEVTRGKHNGWHPHTHWLLALRPGVDGIHHLDEIEMDLSCAWMNSCTNAGLPKPSMERGVDIEVVGSDAKALGQYVAKMGTWDISHEMTLSHLKKGKIKSRSPWQLLSDSMTDKESEYLFIEYAYATKGMRSIIWSRGLKDACGIADLTDSEVAEERATIEELIYTFSDHRMHFKADDCCKVKGIQKFNMVLARGSRLECLKLARSGGSKAVDDYVWSLIKEYREGYEPLDASDPPQRLLPWTQPPNIRLES